MARKQVTSTQQDPRTTSWGTAIGVLAGCIVTLIGVALDLPPLTILQRAAVSGCVIGVMASLLAAGWKLVTPEQEED